MTSNTSDAQQIDAAKPIVALLWGSLLALGLALAARPAILAGAGGLQWSVAGLTLFVGAIVSTFSLRYMRGDPARLRFFVTIALLVAAVLGFVLAGNLVVMAIGWLASGVLLAKLVAHRAEWPDAARAARRIRLTFLAGDLALLSALVLLAISARSLQIADVLAAGPAMPAGVVAVAALLLIGAAAARCALPPFSGWLLSSMTAPTPVSALMHAGLVNAGGFLLLRFAPVLEAAPLVRYAALAVGLFGAIWGIGIMAVRPDIKRSLAGSTVSQMGFMLMSCGLGAYAAALWHLVAHGLFKAWLFLNAGSAIGQYREGRRPALHPRLVPLVAVITLVAGSWLALRAGSHADLVPLLLGFATAITTLSVSLGARLAGRSRIALAAAIAGLAAVHGLGLSLAAQAINRDGPPLLTPTESLVLLAAFLGSWLWQSRQVAQGKPLPKALYVRLLNAGALRPTQTGAAR